MDIDISKHNSDTLVITFDGKLNSENYLKPYKEIEQSTAKGLKNIIFDIEKMAFMDSSGLRVFIQAKKEVGRNNGKVMICGMRENIKKIFDLTDTLYLFELHTSADDAIKSI